MRYLLENQSTNRIQFRKIRSEDFESWLAFFQNPITSIHWIAPKETPLIACENWYQKQFHRYQNDLGGMNALIEKTTGKLIGHCGLLVQKVDEIKELEIGYSLLPEFWNKGFATEAAQKCRDFAFENNFAESLISIISLTNKPSENVALKNGMTLDKTTVYSDNQVNIFRIHQKEWEKITELNAQKP